MSHERWLDDTVDSLDVAVILIGADRTVAYGNAAAHHLFGLQDGGLIGAQVENLLPPERRGELRNFDDVLGGGGARKVRSALKRVDGQRLDISMVIEPCLDEEGRVAAVTVRYYQGPLSSARPPSARTRPPLGMDDSTFPDRSHTYRTLPPRVGSSSPPRSESRLSPTRQADVRRAQVERALRCIEWLEQRLTVPSSVAPLDDASERARAMLVVTEAHGLLQDLSHSLEDEPEIPGAPNVPRL